VIRHCENGKSSTVAKLKSTHNTLLRPQTLVAPSQAQSREAGYETTQLAYFWPSAIP